MGVFGTFLGGFDEAAASWHRPDGLASSQSISLASRRLDSKRAFHFRPTNVPLSAERLKFCLERFPIGAVGVAFSTLLGFQGALELAGVAGESMSEERTPPCRPSGTRGKGLHDFDENFGSSEFTEPEIDLELRDGFPR